MNAEGAAAISSSSVSVRSEGSHPDPQARLELPPLAVVVRLLQEVDNIALEWQGGTDLRQWYWEQYQHHLRGERTVLIADFNGFPIGQAAVLWNGKPTHPHIPDIQSLRVFEAFRGLRVGTTLLEACEDAARARGFTEVSLAVSLENPRAQKLYEKRGYRATGEPYEDEWHYIDAQGEMCPQVDWVIDLIKPLG
jgi:ribosomal protein S18 acetylase RimI-like enzyme